MLFFITIIRKGDSMKKCKYYKKIRVISPSSKVEEAFYCDLDFDKNYYPRPKNRDPKTRGPRCKGNLDKCDQLTYRNLYGRE